VCKLSYLVDVFSTISSIRDSIVRYITLVRSVREITLIRDIMG